jgi:hypothetical protein
VTPTLTAKKCPHAKLEIKAWKVHEQQKMAGLVSSRRFFENADDSEIIAGGVNMKGIHGVALVREAHRLLWGFIAPPSEMTPEARNVFINALVWIHRFDGHQQTAFAGMAARNRIKSILDSPYTDGGNLIRWFPRELLEQTDNDKEKIREHFSGRLPYVYTPSGSGQLWVDQDAEQLKTPNSAPESLVKWVEMLDGDNSDIAKRLLQRYTGKRFRKTGQWRDWVQQYKGQLRFSDERGYRFYPTKDSDEESAADINPNQAEISRDNLTDMAPVQFEYVLQSTHEINGENYQFRQRKVTLVVRARVKDGWYLYPSSADGLGNTPTTIDVLLPDGMSFVDDWQNPVPTDDKLVDGAVFKRVVNVGKPVEELNIIKVRLTFQACNQTQCLRPQTTEFSLPIRVIPR